MPNNVVNNNDHLDHIYIQNAAAMNLNGGNAYHVKVTKSDQSVVTYSDAVYDADWDRIAFTNDKDPIELPNIAKIEFTQA